LPGLHAQLLKGHHELHNLVHRGFPVKERAHRRGKAPAAFPIRSVPENIPGTIGLHFGQLQLHPGAEGKAELGFGVPGEDVRGLPRLSARVKDEPQIRADELFRRTGEIHPHVEVAFAVGHGEFLDEPFSTVERGLGPLPGIGDAAIQSGLHFAQVRPEWDPKAQEKGLRDFRVRVAHGAVRAYQVGFEEPVKKVVGPGILVIAVPPEPVGPFRGVEGAQGLGIGIPRKYRRASLR